MAGLGPQTPFQQPQLLGIARTLVPQGYARDTLHIMLAALESPGALGPASDALAVLGVGQRNQLQAVLRAEIELKKEPLGIGLGDRPTDRLRQCEEIWQSQALQQPLVGVTSALVLGTIIGYDSVVQGILRACGIEPVMLYQSLQPKFAVPESPMGTQLLPQNSGQASPPFGNSGPWVMPPTLEQRASEKAQELIRLVEPTPAREFRSRHPVATGNLLSVLSKAATSSEIPIAVGRRGSPLGELEHVLADCIASGNFTGPHEPLNRYKAVYRLDARVLPGLAKNPMELAPDKVFEQAKLLMQQRQAILVVDHVEAWRGMGVPEALRWHLGNRGDALICGFYEATDEQDIFAEATLGLPNAALVRINAYTADETRDYLNKTYAMAHWAPSGYIFAPEAFDSIYKLEPGCWINLKRMTLPYLVVALGDQTIQTAIHGDEAIRQTARESLEGMRVVRDETARAPESVKNTYEQILRHVQDDLNNLLRNPTPKASGTYKMLTRAHVVAQLFAPNDSEFHLPGFRPSMG